MSAGPDWPFDQAPNVAAITNANVIEQNAPILLVIHYSEDESWALLDGSPTSIEQGRVIGMGTALMLDPTLREISDLRPGWVAERSKVGEAWVRSQDDEM
jgi:hypothetical protein